MGKDSPKTERSSSSARMLIWGAGGAVALAVLLAATLWPAPKEKAERPKHSDRPSVAEVEADLERGLVAPDEMTEPEVQEEAEESPPVEVAIDLFDAPAPEIIEKGHMVVASGRRLHSKRVKQVYEYGKANPGDARPHLILAFDSMNRGWYGFAMDHYKRAVREDPRARQDPRVLEDLVYMTGRKYDLEEAREALAEVFGPNAIPAVKAAIVEAETKREGSRLRRLEDTLIYLEQIAEEQEKER